MPTASIGASTSTPSSGWRLMKIAATRTMRSPLATTESVPRTAESACCAPSSTTNSTSCHPMYSQSRRSSPTSITYFQTIGGESSAITESTRQPSPTSTVRR